MTICKETGVVTLAALLSAITFTQNSWAQQRIVIFDAGIADQLCAYDPLGYKSPRCTAPILIVRSPKVII